MTRFASPATNVGCPIQALFLGLSGTRSTQRHLSLPLIRFSCEVLNFKQSCHPDRSAPGFPATRHSPAPTCAAFSKESRMKLANATDLNRKSGVAQWKDLRLGSIPRKQSY